MFWNINVSIHIGFKDQIIKLGPHVQTKDIFAVISQFRTFPSVTLMLSDLLGAYMCNMINYNGIVCVKRCWLWLSTLRSKFILSIYGYGYGCYGYFILFYFMVVIGFRGELFAISIFN